MYIYIYITPPDQQAHERKKGRKEEKKRKLIVCHIEFLVLSFIFERGGLRELVGEKEDLIWVTYTIIEHPTDMRKSFHRIVGCITTDNLYGLSII